MVSPDSASDPVCGMQVDPRTAIAVEHAGHVYYFCDPACADMFRDDPVRWAPDLMVLTLDSPDPQRAAREVGSAPRRHQSSAWAHPALSPPSHRPWHERSSRGHRRVRRDCPGGRGLLLIDAGGTRVIAGC